MLEGGWDLQEAVHMLKDECIEQKDIHILEG